MPAPIRYRVESRLRRYVRETVRAWYESLDPVLPAGWRACRCRSFHARTGAHTRDCPRS